MMKEYIDLVLCEMDGADKSRYLFRAPKWSYLEGTVITEPIDGIRTARVLASTTCQPDSEQFDFITKSYFIDEVKDDLSNIPRILGRTLKLEYGEDENDKGNE